MPVDWLTIRADPIEAIEHGIGNVAAFNSVHVGPTTFDKMQYPVGEVMPNSFNRTGGNEWTHQIFGNLYFERDRQLDYVDDILHAVDDVINESLAELSTISHVGVYVPSGIDDYAGELDGTSLILVSIEFTVTSKVDMTKT